MDSQALSLKTGGGFDVMNTPTVFNTGFNSLLLWNGEARSLEQQLDGVINNPLHMNSNWPRVLQSISKDPHYVEQFQEIYQAPLHEDQVKNAITTFERSLVTPNSDFDNYLRGDELALSQQQKRGYHLFKQYGCISCHQGINLGGNLFAKFGIYKLEDKPDIDSNPFHLGQYLYTKEISDRYVFRVPSLRNIAVTAPYFHDGSANNLQEAIKTMAFTQLDIILSGQEITDIESFLNSLTGEYKGRTL
jgi:cytochrome c peroxidase